MNHHLLVRYFNIRKGGGGVQGRGQGSGRGTNILISGDFIDAIELNISSMTGIPFTDTSLESIRIGS